MKTASPENMHDGHSQGVPAVAIYIECSHFTCIYYNQTEQEYVGKSGCRLQDSLTAKSMINGYFDVTLAEYYGILLV